MTCANPPSRQTTGGGYVYYRDRSGDTDVTVYEHQLNAILAGFSPYDVFASDTEVHHRNLRRFDNRPSNLCVENGKEHRTQHLHGEKRATV